MKPPHNVAFLERGIRKLTNSNENGVRLRTMMSSIIVGQFLDGAVMRGGGALKLRYGAGITRYTIDFDAALRVDEERFVEEFNRRLEEGWSLFSGRLVKLPKAHPANVPEAYVMQPFEVRLTYKNQSWCSVRMEVSYNEVGDADEYDEVPLDPYIKLIFAQLNLPEPRPVPLMKLVHQVAQKIHGATDIKAPRAQDVIDLQLIAGREMLDLRELKRVSERLFANRKAQSWPPKVNLSGEMVEAYAALKGDLPVLPDCASALNWLSDFIANIQSA